MRVCRTFTIFFICIRCIRFLPRDNSLKTYANRYGRTDRTVNRTCVRTYRTYLLVYVYQAFKIAQLKDDFRKIIAGRKNKIKIRTRNRWKKVGCRYVPTLFRKLFNFGWRELRQFIYLPYVPDGN